MTKDKFIHVVKRNNQRLYMLALSFTKNHDDSEDILQNVFLKLWKYGGEFENDDHIDKWLTRVCINESKNDLKLSFRKNTTLNDAMDLYTFDSWKDFDVFSAVMSLPKKERVVKQRRAEHNRFNFANLPKYCVKNTRNTQSIPAFFALSLNKFAEVKLRRTLNNRFFVHKVISLTQAYLPYGKAKNGVRCGKPII